MADASPRSSAPPVDDKNETFVFKLHRMVEDPSHQYLLSWSAAGTSFIVYNGMEFARDVLPKFFKHNNFSSFVRQLNMYGFHKINEAPRSPRASVEQQVWEFSHPRFIRDRSDLLADIKRKVVSSGGPRSPSMSVSQELDYDPHQNLCVPGTIPLSGSPGPITLTLPSSVASSGGTISLSPSGSLTVNTRVHPLPPVERSVSPSNGKRPLEIDHISLGNLNDGMDTLFRENDELRRQLSVYQSATRKLLEALLRQQSVIPPNFPRAIDPHDLAVILNDLPHGNDMQPSIVVSSVVEPHYVSARPHLSNPHALHPTFEIKHHSRTSSFTNAINTPIPNSPLTSPVGSPLPTPMVAPTHGAPLHEHLTEEEYHHKPDPQHHHPWSY